MAIKTLIVASMLATSLWSELETVQHVDITRYLGDWEEIARLPTERQDGCIETTAHYAQAKDIIQIKNTCTMVDGKKKVATGRAKIIDPNNAARLKVNFTPFFIRMFGAGWGNYWIIELGDNYEYAVVSEPKMEKLWILSRTKPMSKEHYDGIVQRLQAKGFSTEKIIVSLNALVNK